MTTKFVVMNKGLDYNDEVYSAGGDGSSVLKETFASKEEAQEFAKQKTIDLLTTGNFNYSFDKKEGKYVPSPAPFELGVFSYSDPYCEPALNLDWTDHYESDYKQVYDWCQENGEDFFEYVPKEEFFSVFEVEV